MGTCTCIACVDIHNFQILIELINNALIPCQGLTNSLPIAPARDNLKLSWVQRECLEIFLPTNCTNFRASECKTVLVRAMPSAAENLEERQYVTGHVNKELIALVQISATDPVAILIHCNHSCPLVQFVGKKNFPISRGQKNAPLSKSIFRPLYAFFIPEKPANPALVPLIP